MLMDSRNHHNIVIILQLKIFLIKLKIKLKKQPQRVDEHCKPPSPLALGICDVRPEPGPGLGSWSVSTGHHGTVEGMVGVVSQTVFYVTLLCSPKDIT